MSLEAAWRRLEHRQPLFSASQGYDFTRSAWELSAQDRSRQSMIVAVWRGAELVGVWPLSLQSKRGLRTVAHLGFGANEEYAAPLLLEEQAADISSVMIAAVRPVADLIYIWNVPASSSFDVALSMEEFSTLFETVSSYVVSCRGISEFSFWVAAKSGSFRKGLRYDRRQLSTQGEVSFKVFAGREDDHAFVEWLFDTKRRWLARQKVLKSWIYEERGLSLATSLISTGERDDAGVLGPALLLDGRLIAAALCFVSKKRLELFMFGFDPDFSRFSPGSLLLEECVRYAVARGLDFDMRMTPSLYKSRWADREDTFKRYVLATTQKGRIALAILRWQGAFERNLGKPLRALLKPLYLRLAGRAP